MTSRSVKVAVRAESYAYDKPYTYLVPEGLTVKNGMRVLVPFGAGNRLVQAVILSCSETMPTDMKCKYISKVLDTEPVVNETDIGLMLWLRERCFCTCYDVLRSMIPVGLDFKEDNTYYPLPDPPVQNIPTERSKAKPIYDYIVGFPSGISEDKLIQHFSGIDITSTLNTLIKKKLIDADHKETRVCGNKQLVYVSLSDEVQCKRPSPSASAVIAFLQGGNKTPLNEVCYYTGVKPPVIKRLIENGTLISETVDAPAPLLPQLKNDNTELLPNPELNDEQLSVFRGLCNLSDTQQPNVSLLYGITGSGKTFVYISLIRHCIQQGRKAIVLVPEIALTPQLLLRFRDYFGNRIALIHSSLSVRDRFNQWNRIRSGEVDVVIGTRSAVFAPVENLGLIILDEEQEYSYRSENTPCYHARDVAKYRAAKCNAMVLLGSATPSVESMYFAQTGVYTLFRLNQRYGDATLPNVFISDMHNELRSGNGGLVGTELQSLLTDAFAEDHQAILFLNRRGNARSILCHQCGKTVKCPNCSVSLTYHSANGRMMCHYCGYSKPLVVRCPNCRSGNLTQEGGGTQKAEAELNELFPTQSVIRMDADTATGMTGHEKILTKFREENISMMVGTQMIAKGLDFPNVTIVGVLDADQMLGMPDFRASERAFSMITQAVGRSGRGTSKGCAVIQTYDPDEPTLKTAARQDYDDFYNHEITFRKAFEYPPFCDLLCLELTDTDQARLYYAANYISEQLKYAISGTVYPPAPAPIFKINNKLRYRVIAKTTNTKEMRSAVSNILKQFLSESSFSGIGLHATLNPYD